MGNPRRGAQPPNQVAYYVALGCILVLLLLLCCYFFYFCLTRVKELSRQLDSPTQPVNTSSAAPTYPVQPVVRDTATAMAKLCKQLPPTAPVAAKGDTVFPASTSPGATLGSVGESGDEDR